MTLGPQCFACGRPSSPVQEDGEAARLRAALELADEELRNSDVRAAHLVLRNALDGRPLAADRSDVAS